MDFTNTISIKDPNERNLWGEYSYFSSTDKKRIKRIKHLVHGHTISLHGRVKFENQIFLL